MAVQFVYYPQIPGGSTAPPTSFLLNGATTTVTEDTITPANNLPLPVQLVDSSGNANKVSATQSGAWNITNISGTVSLPTGASTEATLASASAKLPATLGQKAMSASLAVALASDQSSIPVTSAQLPASLGQKVMASSSPVVIASDQSSIPVAATQSGAWNITNVSGTVSLPTGASTETTLSAVSGKLPATLGQKVSASSLAVVIASDQSTLPVSGTVTVNPNGGTIVTVLTGGSATTSAAQLVATGSWISVQIQNLDSIPIFLGDSSVTTDTGSKPGVRLMPGDSFSWTSSAACFVIAGSTGGTNKISLVKFT